MLVQVFTLVLLTCFPSADHAKVGNKSLTFFDGFFNASDTISIGLILIGIVLLVFVWYYSKKN